MHIKDFLTDPSWNDTLPLRAYYIPYGSEAATVKPREESEAVTPLDGLWEFAALGDINDWNGTADCVTPQKIAVPSCVQWEGYDEMQYVNVRYPFPYDPPYIRKANPAFLYRRTFTVSGADKKRYLVFDGVDSCCFLFVNGQFLGYSQVSHRMSEWDITPYVHAGENELFAVVAKWCAGSYLEDQDKWRTSGIFRSVYLLERPHGHIEDYRIRTATEGTRGIIRFTYERGGAPASVKLADGKPVKCEAGQTVEFSISNAKLWNAEEPHLYDLIVECAGEYIRERVGIRVMRIKNKTVLLNGRKFKCKGICRHEFHPYRGATVTAEETRRDLLLIKQNNFNAIRTSHYPDIPQFYAMCDEIGLYVLAESDLECHGVITQEGNFDEQNHFHDLANSPLYREPILFRQQCSVEREKNRCCVLFWSLGNESGYGDNFESAADWVHKRDGERLVHYEGISKTEGTPLYYTDKLDVVSRMYPTPEWMDELKNDEKERRPMVLCECAHSMGNGPGDISRYWDVIYRNDNLAGAFIWQFADSTPLPNPLSEKFMYGGDFGEKLHDGAFIASGVFDALRREKQPLIEHRVTLQPVRVFENGGKYTLKSMLDFATAAVEGKAVVKAGEKEAASFPVSLTLEPGQTAAVAVPWSADAEYEGEYISVQFGLTVSYGGNTYPAQAAFTRQKASTALPISDGKTATSARIAGGVRIGKGTTALEVDCKTGSIRRLYFGGRSVLKEPIEFNIWRAPVDNDAPLRALWKQWGLEEAVPYAETIRTSESCVLADCMLVTDYRTPPVRYTQEVTLLSEHAIGITVSYRVSDYVKFIPRVGIKFALDKAARKVAYLGNGPCESYSDKCVGAIKDIYRADAKEMFRSYIVPQECGGHNNTDWLTLTDENTELTARSDKPFAFSVLPYSAAQLQSVTHSWQLPESDADYICLDEGMTGMGSASCGPAMHEKYLLQQRAGKFTFTIELKKNRQ